MCGLLTCACICAHKWIALQVWLTKQPWDKHQPNTKDERTLTVTVWLLGVDFRWDRGGAHWGIRFSSSMGVPSHGLSISSSVNAKLRRGQREREEGVSVQWLAFDGEHSQACQVLPPCRLLYQVQSNSIENSVNLWEEALLVRNSNELQSTMCMNPRRKRTWL